MDDNGAELVVASGDLSYEQYVAANIVTMCSSTASVMGSGGIITIILATFIKQRQSTSAASSRPAMGTYQRLMLGMSISDIYMSIQFVTQIFLIPTTKENAPWAIGNSTTCTAQAATSVWFNTLVITYSVSLSLYFLLCVKYNWSDKQIYQRMELPVHLWAVGLATLLMAAGLVTDGYDVMPLSEACYFGDYELPPFYFNATTNTTVYLTSSERGFIPTILNSFHIAYYLLCVVLSVVLTIAVYRHVKWQLNRTRHTRLFSMPSTMTSPSTTVASSTVLDTTTRTNMSSADGSAHNRRRLFRRRGSSSSHPNNNNNNNNMDNTVDNQIREVAWQATWYTIAYLNGFIWPFLRLFWFEFAGTEDIDNVQGEPLHYTLYLLTQIFHPLQGAFNFIVFVRPKFVQWRKTYPTSEDGATMFWILKQLFRGEQVPSVQNGSRHQQRSTRRAMVLTSTGIDTHRTGSTVSPSSLGDDDEGGTDPGKDLESPQQHNGTLSEIQSTGVLVAEALELPQSGEEDGSVVAGLATANHEMQLPSSSSTLEASGSGRPTLAAEAELPAREGEESEAELGGFPPHCDEWDDSTQTFH